MQNLPADARKCVTWCVTCSLYTICLEGLSQQPTQGHQTRSDSQDPGSNSRMACKTICCTLVSATVCHCGYGCCNAKQLKSTCASSCSTASAGRCAQVYANAYHAVHHAVHVSKAVPTVQQSSLKTCLSLSKTISHLHRNHHILLLMHRQAL